MARTEQTGWKTFLLFLVVIVVVSDRSFAQDEEYRGWTDKSGKFKITARIVQLRNNTAYLEQENGKVISVALSKLSQVDIDYLRQHREFSKNVPDAENSDTPFREISGVSYSGQPDRDGIIRRIKGISSGIHAATFSVDGQFLFTATHSQISATDVENGTRFYESERLENMQQMKCMGFSNKKTPSRLLVGGTSGRIQTWIIGDNGRLVEDSRFVAHTAEIHCITMSADDQWVLSGGNDKTARFWNVSTGEQKHEFGGFRGGVKATLIAPDNSQGLASDGQSLALLDLKTGEIVQSMALTGSSSAQTVAFSPGGEKVIVHDTYKLRIWDVKKGDELRPLEGNEIPWVAKFTPDGRHVVSGGRKKLNVWNIEKQIKVKEFDCSMGYIQSLAISPNGRYVAAQSHIANSPLEIFELTLDD